MSNEQKNDEVLFDEIKKNRKRRKRKTVTVAVILAALAAGGIFFGVRTMRKRVNEQFLRNTDEVLSYQATVGSVSTTVSGSGVLAAVDTRQLTVPAGVEIDELTVRRGAVLSAGEVVATVRTAGVMTALADAQEALDTLAEEIDDAEDDAVSSYIFAGLHGRLKKLYAAAGDGVTDCMAENGALALISVDGYMTVDVATDQLSAGDSVKVRSSDGTEYPGTVEKRSGGSASVLLTDNGPVFGDTVEIFTESGESAGSGELAIHSPVAVTGYAGTVSELCARENQYVYAETSIFRLTDTAFSANYDQLLRDRAEKEEELRTLVDLLRSGCLCAPCDGTVISVDYTEGSETGSTETAVITLAPHEQVSVSISVDETDILSLAPGQSADVTVSSIGDESYSGTVTAIDKTAESSSGVSYYTAEITLDKAEDMLFGMTASVDIRIEGVDSAVIIPADALHRTATGAFVYTSYDEETHEYGGMKDVIPGISNSKFVEITSGLSAGETVYYVEKETDDFFAQFGGMSSMPGGNGGAMPGGMSGMPGGNAGSMPGAPGGMSGAPGGMNGRRGN